MSLKEWLKLIVLSLTTALGTVLFLYFLGWLLSGIVAKVWSLS